jgi:hypothetical protein
LNISIFPTFLIALSAEKKNTIMQIGDTAEKTPQNVEITGIQESSR